MTYNARTRYDIENQLRHFVWYQPLPDLTTNAIEAQFTATEMANLRLLAQRRNALSPQQ